MMAYMMIRFNLGTSKHIHRAH